MVQLRCLLVAAALGAVGGMAGAATAQAGVVQVATLSEPAGSHTTLGQLASSGPTAVAAGLGASYGAYVFQESANGWSNASAVASLSDSHGAWPTGAGIDGETIVLNETNGTASYVDVFTRPAGGWAGDVEQAASLVASDGTEFGPPAVSGSVVVAPSTDPKTGFGAVYVFVEPSSGWAGTQHEVAKLEDPKVPSFWSATIAGDVIVADDGERADVFVEPAGGWSSSMTPSAVLRSAQGQGLDPVAISGRTVTAGNQVFVEPVKGWSGSVRPTNILFTRADIPYVGEAVEALGGTTAAITGFTVGSEHTCPCNGVVSLFTVPRTGPSATLVSQPELGYPDDENGSLAVAIDGPDVLITGGDIVEVYRVTGTFGQEVQPPSASHVRISGVGAGAPELGFKLGTGAYGAPLKSVAIRPPRELAFVRSARRLRRAVKMGVGDKATITLRHGILTLVFKRIGRRASILIRSGAFVTSRSLIGSVKTTSAHGKPLRVRLRMTLTENYSVSSRFTFRVALR